MTADNIAAQWGQVMQALTAKGTVPPGTVNSWLRGFEPVSFRNGIFTVFAMNRCALEVGQKYISQIEIELTEIIGSPVKLVVTLSQDDVPDDEAVETETKTKTDVQVNAASSSSDVIQIVDTQIRAQLTRPDRVVSIDRYLLRWVNLVGADVIIATLGLRQLAYLSHTNDVVTTTDNLVGWCGMSRNALLGMFKKPEFHLLVHRTVRSSRIVSGRRFNQSAIFTLPRVWPLLPADARIVEYTLIALGFVNNPVGVLSGLLSGDLLDLDTLLPNLPDDPEPDDVNFDWTYVSTICKRLLQDVTLPREEMTRVIMMSEQIHERITHHGTINVAWYFFQNWAGILGPQATLTVLQLRARTYFSEMETRATTRLTLSELAALSGISADSIGRWFPVRAMPDNRYQAKCDALAKFVLRGDINAQYEVAFTVLEPHLAPLTPDDEAKAMRMMLAGGTEFLDSGEAEGTEKMDSGRVGGTENLDSGEVEPTEKTDSGERNFWTPVNGKNGLILKDSLNHFNNFQKESPPPLKSVGVDFWNFEEIIQRKVVSKAAQIKLLEDPARFLAWLLSGFVDPKITNPVSLAVTTCTRTQAIPDKRFMDLIKNGPSSLQEALETIAEAKTEGTIAEILDPENEWIPLLQKIGPRAADLLLILGITS